MAATTKYAPPQKRRPLGDGTQSANIIGRPPQTRTKSAAIPSASSSCLPHHEKLMPNGSLTVQDITSSPENKHLSAITNESQPDSKRDSQVSTTSTNASSTKGGRRKTHIGPWELGRDIGHGHSCKVRKVRHTVTGQQAAVKIIDKKVAEQARSESLSNLAEMARRSKAGALMATSNVMPFGVEREVVILKLLEHPNVVKLYDIWENRNQLYLVMEYVDGGELFDYVADQDFLAEDETVWLFRQMVAALLHCHRLGIHHRDLKPENILIDTSDDSLQVKLADFGMAALQPRGKQLTTACGSVHYAAPEVFERRYDGSKVDVWSLGVILYVMLTGTTPFTYDQQTMANDVSVWYNIIKSGLFPMPDELSNEAQDLIRKMLKPEPRNRISLEGVWNHPLVHKYESDWGETQDNGDLDRWIGPQPVIEIWNVKKKDDIDREILRNLRVLWHSEQEEALMDKILSEEPNQEKYFYFALQRHREEQLENYVGSPDSMAFASSDYHHMKTKCNGIPVPQAAPAVRSKSQFSILNDEHLRSRESLTDPPSSIRSYDPFRASRYPITTGKENNYTSVVIHRRASQQSRCSGTSSLRKPSSLRVESLRKSQRQLSTASGSGSPQRTMTRYSSHSVKSTGPARRSMSRSSIGSSLYPSSPPVVIKANSKHKRPVNFSHISRTSIPRTSASNRSEPKTTTPCHKRESIASLKKSPIVRSSSISIPVDKIHSLENESNQVDSKNTNGNTLGIESEARKVSTELEKFCEEAFNRLSAGSSHRTSATISHRHSATPPSSVSNPKSVASLQDTALSSQPKSLISPTLQPTKAAISPVETPNTFIARELAETRKRFAARYAHDHSLQSDHYLEVLAHLDSFIRPPLNSNKRSSSAPEPSAQLPVITEDRLLDTIDIPQHSTCSQRDVGQAAVRSGDLKYESGESRSIRVVDSSPPRPAPLVIRKTSRENVSHRTVENAPFQTGSRLPVTPRNPPTRKNSITSTESLQTICEEQPRLQMNQKPPIKGNDLKLVKKRSWWHRKRSAEAANPVVVGHDVIKLKDTNYETQSQYPSNPDIVSQPKFVRFEQSGKSEEKKPALLRFFGKKRSASEAKSLYLGNDPSEDTDRKSRAVSVLSPTSSTAGSNLGWESQDGSNTRDLGVQQHWLARILHIKPASKVLCFQVMRGRARAEITRLLRSWRPHGIRDVVLDRERNLVFARLDAINALGFKEVEFVAEIFVVLEKGERKGLSIARFTQRKGAASSFRRVLEEIESRLTAKGMLIVEKETRREMEALLAEGQAK